MDRSLGALDPHAGSNSQAQIFGEDCAPCDSFYGVNLGSQLDEHVAGQDYLEVVAADRRINRHRQLNRLDFQCNQNYEGGEQESKECLVCCDGVDELSEEKRHEFGDSAHCCSLLLRMNIRAKLQIMMTLIVL